MPHRRTIPSLLLCCKKRHRRNRWLYSRGGIHPDETATGKLLRIAVAPKYQWMECGTMFTRKLLAKMMQRGIEVMHLVVAETNIPAITFYKKSDFLKKSAHPSIFIQQCRMQ
ncbi:MAG: GNAT family N-acetyltransferase [Methanocalculaceae archaeon]|nr:GNAT family N-acetyltransferase [Methanocalculaceae archaeon]